VARDATFLIGAREKEKIVGGGRGCVMQAGGKVEGRGRWWQLWKGWRRAEASELKAEVVNVRGGGICGDSNNNKAQSRSGFVIHLGRAREREGIWMWRLGFW